MALTYTCVIAGALSGISTFKPGLLPATDAVGTEWVEVEAITAETGCEKSGKQASVFIYTR